MIYIRVPKTGSNSFLTAMKKMYECEQVGEGMGPHWEHWTAQQAKELIDPKIWETYEKIGFIRHPHKWVVSIYHLKETFNMWMEDNNKPFPEFLSNLKITIFDHWFVDDDGELLIDKIYKTEDLREFLLDKGCIGVEDIHINKTHRSKPIIDLTEDDKKIIREKFWREFEYYPLTVKPKKEREKEMVIVKRTSNNVGINVNKNFLDNIGGNRRGLTPDEIEKDRADRMIQEPEIVEIISHRVGGITVKKDDGCSYDRAGGTLSWRNHNPGNIKHGAFAKGARAIGRGQGGHAVFASIKDGREAMKKLLFTPIRRYHKKTLLNALRTYAPVGDKNNNPDRYAKYVAAKLGISTSAVLNTLNGEQQEKMLDAMIVFEGYKFGREVMV